MRRSKSSRIEALAPIGDSTEQIVGRKFVRILDELLDDLRRQHQHPNRSLYYDDVVVAHLLAFFNPALRGLRSIQDLFDDPKVRKAFRSPRVPKSTLADAQRLFDPELLRPMIEHLKERVGRLPHAPPLDAVTKKILAVDGSFFAVAPRIAWALFNQNKHRHGKIVQKGNVRLHTHFDIQLGLPDQVGLTDGRTDEGQHLSQRLQADCFYVMDRGFQSYQLLASILAASSDFLVRLRKTATADLVEQRALAATDQAAQVVEDAVVRLGWRSDQTPSLPNLRRVTISTTDREGNPSDVILLTNRLDLPAHVIARLYQYRWQVELFFRWLKCMAHFEHFFSESQEGMTLQVYVAIIGTLLLAVYTGVRPSKYDYALMSSAILGWTSIEYVQLATARRRAAQEAAARRKAERAVQKNAR
jgi:hypothetical protein